MSRMTASAASSTRFLLTIEIAAFSRNRVEVAHERRIAEIEQQDERHPADAGDPREEAEDEQHADDRQAVHRDQVGVVEQIGLTRNPVEQAANGPRATRM